MAWTTRKETRLEAEGPEVQYFGIRYLPFHFEQPESQNVDFIDQILLILLMWKKE